MEINGRGRVSGRLLNRVLFLSLLIFFSGAIFFYESGKEGYYAEVINLSGRVRGGIQRAAKLYLGGEIKKLKEVSQQVDTSLKLLTQRVDYITLPIVDWGKDYRPYGVQRCWNHLKVLLKGEPSEENEKKVLNLSEECWYKADRLTLLYQRLVSRNLFILNLFYALILGLSSLIIFYLVKLIVVDVRQYLERRATFDPLTGILNRGSFQELFRRLSSLELSYPMGFIVFDLDNFKRVNDTYGHIVGDRVLQKVAKVVKKHIRRTDIFARWGGEEFVLLLPQTDLEGTRKVAEKLRRALEEVEIPPFGLKITASFGATEVLPGEGLKEVFERADKALYRAKALGKNRVEVEPPPTGEKG